MGKIAGWTVIKEYMCAIFHGTSCKWAQSCIEFREMLKKKKVTWQRKMNITWLMKT